MQHGTVTVLMDKEGYEVTTYRVDGDDEIRSMQWHIIRKKGFSEWKMRIKDAVSVIRWERFHEDALRICAFPHSWDLQLKKKRRLVFRHWHRI